MEETKQKDKEKQIDCEKSAKKETFDNATKTKRHFFMNLEVIIMTQHNTTNDQPVNQLKFEF